MRDLIKLFRPGLVVFAVTLSSLAATTSVASMAACTAAIEATGRSRAKRAARRLRPVRGLVRSSVVTRYWSCNAPSSISGRATD